LDKLSRRAPGFGIAFLPGTAHLVSLNSASFPKNVLGFRKTCPQIKIFDAKRIR
jgi:hypothetical protein